MACSSPTGTRSKAAGCAGTTGSPTPAPPRYGPSPNAWRRRSGWPRSAWPGARRGWGPPDDPAGAALPPADAAAARAVPGRPGRGTRLAATRPRQRPDPTPAGRGAQPGGVRAAATPGRGHRVGPDCGHVRADRAARRLGTEGAGQTLDAYTEAVLRGDLPAFRADWPYHVLSAGLPLACTLAWIVGARWVALIALAAHTGG